VLRFIFTFNEFDDIYLLTGGAAGTQVASVRVYDLLTARGDIGAASAQGRNGRYLALRVPSGRNAQSSASVRPTCPVNSSESQTLCVQLICYWRLYGFVMRGSVSCH